MQPGLPLQKAILTISLIEIPPLGENKKAGQTEATGREGRNVVGKK